MATMEQVIERYTGEVESGKTLFYCEQSWRSADLMGYYSMMPNSTYSNVVIALGKAASLGDFYADAVSAALRKINPAQNDYMMAAGIAAGLREFASQPWIDVRQMSGPEAGRPSSWTHNKPSLVQMIMLNLILTEVTFSMQLGSVPGLGWVMKELVVKNGIHVYSNQLPNIAKVEI